MRIELSKNSDWGRILLSFGEKERQFSFHIPSGEVFNDDPDPLIRVKCFALIALTPLLSLIRSVSWCALACFLWLQEGFYVLDGRPILAEMKLERIHAFEDSGRALSYGVWLTAHACVGLLYPYLARQRYGCLERELNRQADGPHHNKYYLAFCFQRLCIMSSDPSQHHLTEERLVKYLTRVKAIHDAQNSCEWTKLNVAINDLQQSKP